jgi:hypothetical protein
MPNGISRFENGVDLSVCAYQLANLAEIADRMHLPVKVIAPKDWPKKLPILHRIKHLLSDNYDGAKIYIAKLNTFFYNDSWERVENLNAFKVCLSVSDNSIYRVREKSMLMSTGRGGDISTRCDLCMSVNCMPELFKCDHKTILVAHRPHPKMFDLFTKMHLDHAFLDDDVKTIRDAFKHDEIGLAGFMGRKSARCSPNGYGERDKTSGMPDWVNLTFRGDASAEEYVKYLLSYRACVDLRGGGDKSHRFIEAVLFNRTIITKPQKTPYCPPLTDGNNAVIVENWNDLNQPSKRESWRLIADRATNDYLHHWSQLAQLKMILERAKSC